METKHKVHTLDSVAEYNEDNKRWAFTQDEKPFLEAAKLDRELGQKRDIGYKKACTIPTIVQLEILEKYGVDMMSDEFMQDPSNMKWLLNVIKTEYPLLMSY